MPFISKKERQKRIDKLQSTESGKRFFVLLSIVITIVFIALLVIMQLLPFFPGSIKDIATKYLNDGEWIKWGADDKIIGFTPYGLGMTISTCFVITMLVASFIIFLSLHSLKWGFNETIDLMKQSSPGETGKFAIKGKLKQIINKRLTAPQSKKGKK